MKNMQYYFFLFVLAFQIHVKAQNDTDSFRIKNQEINLLFIGDFMGHQDQIDAAYDSSSNSYSYDSCFHYIRPWLSDADFTIANIETTLGIKPYSGYPQFSSPPAFAEAIRRSGVDIVATVNNHSVDKSKAGMERTLFVLDSLKMRHMGTYYSPKDKDSLSPLIVEKNGIKVALLSYTYGTNSLNPIPPNIVNYLDSNTISKDVIKAKSHNPDVIVAYVHWGIQYKDYPSKSQKAWNNYFKSLGVKIVIGSHPHVVQPMKWNKSDSSLVVYSLGNFISHQRTFPRDGGAIFKLILKKTDGQVVIQDAKYSLSWVYEPEIDGKKKYFVLPVKAFENKPDFFAKRKDFDKMQRYIKHARSLMKETNENIVEY